MQIKEKDYKFISSLSQWIIGFLEEKHRLGYKYEREYFELKNWTGFRLTMTVLTGCPENSYSPGHSVRQTIAHRRPILKLT